MSDENEENGSHPFQQMLPAATDTEHESLVALPKAIVMNPGRSKVLDQHTVAFQYYNSFNYSLLKKKNKGIRLAIGITSANPGEGKSLVASNLAVSLTLGYKKKTVLVDLNINRPSLHEIFGTSTGPGLIEALNDGDIHLWETPVDHLHLLSCGGKSRTNGSSRNGHHGSSFKHRYLDLDQMTSFSDVITSLQQEYEFVIVDMPSMNNEDFPILFANRLDGLLMVVDSVTTKRNDMEKVFRRLNEQQILGFILNKVSDKQE
ncbi:MAG: CpsD/CapB family tyrosine-protein kinase [Ignavibacteriales bacterium]|nr:CpsD/CapB family tyrosine-protein kinase [Ignavibacteriales bacterium]